MSTVPHTGQKNQSVGKCRVRPVQPVLHNWHTVYDTCQPAGTSSISRLIYGQTMQNFDLNAAEDIGESCILVEWQAVNTTVQEKLTDSTQVRRLTQQGVQLMDRPANAASGYEECMVGC